MIEDKYIKCIEKIPFKFPAKGDKDKGFSGYVKIEFNPQSVKTHYSIKNIQGIDNKELNKLSNNGIINGSNNFHYLKYKTDPKEVLFDLVINNDLCKFYDIKFD